MPPVIPTEGLNRIAALILAETTYIAAGTDNTEPSSADTQLGAENNRGAATVIQDGNMVTFKVTLANAALPAVTEEIGLFLNGAAGANTGEIAVRALVPFTKGSDDLLVVIELTVNEG